MALADAAAAAKKTLLRKIPHGVFICGVAENGEVNGFTASWVTQGSFEPPLVVMAVRSDSTTSCRTDATDFPAMFGPSANPVRTASPAFTLVLARVS